MSIAARITAIFVAAAIVLCCAATVYTAHRAYQVEFDRIIERSGATLEGNPYLRVGIYRQDEAELESLLARFLQPAAASLAVVYDSQGRQLAQTGDASSLATVRPGFALLRKDVHATDLGLSAFDTSLNPVGVGLWSALWNPEAMVHLTLPVFSPVNPTARDLGPLDFLVTPDGADAPRSLLVMGYLQVGIEARGLLDAIVPSVSRVFILGLGLVLLCVAAVAWATRRITSQLSRLARLADQVVSGEIAERVEIEGSGELKDIANVLNRVIGGVSDYRRELDVDHKLLALRADERANQLSEQTEQLNKANEEVMEARGQLHRMAYYDSLTALPNRRLFTEQLDLLLRLTQRERKPLALLMIALDNFKKINDSLGHSTGDLVLQEVAKRLTGCLRASDMLSHNVDGGPSIDVSRLGGDEFTIVLNQLDQVESAAQVAQRLVDRLVEPIHIEGHELVVKPSIGIAVAPRDADSVDGLIRAADVAMYHTRSAVNRKFLFYHEDMAGTGPDHIKLEAELRKALERGQLRLHYQPQVDTGDGSIVSAEALLRWDHPEYGHVPPLKFIPLAEDIGIIGELGDWVLTEATRQLKAFREDGLKLPRVAINVSTFQFGAAFVERIREVFEASDLDPSALELDLSEALLMNKDAETFQALRELREMGVYLSVDDFGTGYAPIGYLGRYPLDEIKIDRSFVRDCERRSESGRLVLATIAMAKSLGLRVVAEGVETAEEYRFLTANGVRLMQGYLFSKPVPALELQQQLNVGWHFMEQVQRLALQVQSDDSGSQSQRVSGYQ